MKPKYVTEIPQDIFGDGELHYRPEGTGYLLYSVGVNEKDDGGKTQGPQSRRRLGRPGRSHDGGEITRRFLTPLVGPVIFGVVPSRPCPPCRIHGSRPNRLAMADHSLDETSPLATLRETRNMKIALPLAFGIVVGLALSSFAAPPPVNQKAIDDIRPGRCKIAQAAWWIGPGGSTRGLPGGHQFRRQKVIVEKMPSPWIVDQIMLAANQELVFEKGVVVVAKKEAFHGHNDSLFRAWNKANLKLTGYAQRSRCTATTMPVGDTARPSGGTC